MSFVPVQNKDVQCRHLHVQVHNDKEIDSVCNDVIFPCADLACLTAAVSSTINSPTLEHIIRKTYTIFL
jgi:hypothetical protein